MKTLGTRTPLQVTWNVWEGLFLREAVARLSADRIAWIWLVAEPIAHVALLVWLRTIMGRIKIIPGADFIPWLVVGITLFIMFRNQLNRGMEAINANKSLFAYRQVLPVDTVLIRCGLEGLLSSVVVVLMLFGFSAVGYDMTPHRPLGSLLIWVTVLCFGLGVALILSTAVTIAQELSKFIRMAMFPLYFLSGIMIPVKYFPRELQEYLLYNPVLHGVELIRLGYFEYYRVVDGISYTYLLLWTTVSLTLGFLLQMRFSTRLVAK
ncbi:ABC transporter permease [Marinobacter nauticus]|uniref:ABC transporter permease n=1 Tax=Marinobacter nauticus TaxID=2743 RepID=UPI000EAFC5D7|nr:ABC transporter permease [Marinobacter nauticus]RKR77549.1 capsular polysaccharide transport system permease protein [Marinobacter nauticus]